MVHTQSHIRRLDPQIEERLVSGAREADRFFMKKSKEKPVAFPDPAKAAVRGERFALLPLADLLELKIASGMTAPHRLRDLADAIELIRVNALEESFAESLHPYVQEKFRELWKAAQTRDEE